MAGAQPTAPTLLTMDMNTLSSAYGSNPYTAQATSDGNAANAQMQQVSSQMGGLQSQYSGMGGTSAPGAYPTYQNSFGLGSGAPMGQAAPPAAATPGAASNPSYMAEPLTTAQPDASSRGFNPWSLAGESNSRGH